MVIYTVQPGRGRSPLQPQLFFNPDLVLGSQPFAQFDWPVPRGYEYHNQLRTLTSGPAPRQTIPFVKTDWPNPQPVTWYQSWTYPYILDLIGQDKFPVGEVIYNLPPQLVDTQVRGWLQTVNYLTVPVGKQTNQLTPDFRDYRSWTWSQQLQTTVVAQLPPGQTTNQLVSGPDYPIQLRTLINSPAPVFVAVNFPFNKSDWPLAQTYAPPIQSWTWQYNLNLIGMDQFPVGGNTTGGQNDTHGIFIPPPYVDYTWLHSPQVPPVVVQQLPPGQLSNIVLTGPDYPIQLRTLINAPAPVFVAVTQLPFNQIDWPVPQQVIWFQDWRQSPQVPPVVNPSITFGRITDLPWTPRLEYFRDFNQNIILLFPPPPPPPVTDLHFRPWLSHMGRMGNLGGFS